MKENRIGIALIPAYEPGEALLKLLEQLSRADFEMIVVDDGSGGAYAQVFQQASAYAKVLRHTKNRGKGAALKTGMSYILQNFGEDGIVVTVDADGQHRAKDARRLCETARRRPDALILGSRSLKEHVPARSRFGNTITRHVYRLSTGLKVHDTQTGLRAFSVSLLPTLLAVSGERYEYEMNVLLAFARKHIPIMEITVDTVYIDRNAASHFNTVRDSARIYKEILRFSASSFAGFLTDYAVYGLLLLCVPRLWMANVGARVVSATVNYTLNRRFVFRSARSVKASAPQYVLLAAVILAGNTLLLSLFVDGLGINRMAAKIFVELIFFAVSWLVQRCIIFRRRERSHGGGQKTDK